MNKLLIILIINAVYVTSLTHAAKSTDDEKKNEYGTVIGIDLGTTYSW
jgi:hypothetical protein